MKISSIICAAVLTVASANAAAPILSLGQPSTQAQVTHGAEKAIRSHAGEACRGSGQVCGIKMKLKRAATTVSESLKSKRAAEAAAQMDSTDNPTAVSDYIQSMLAPVAVPRVHITAQPSTPVEALKDAVNAVEPHSHPHPVPACRGSGQACGIKAKLKRAADVAAEAAAEPISFAEPPHRFCYTPGGECSNAKREALALAEAAAEAYAIAEPEANPCYLPGGECSNAKREAIAAAEMMAERDAGAFPDAEAGM